MAGAKDKYGIPPGGNNGSWSPHFYKGNHYQISWMETMAAIALAGWPEHQWGMAGAVCAAESGRHPFIYNDFKKGHFGIFQISRAAWPEFFDESTNGGMSWISPNLNAKKAYQIFKAQGWGAWEGHGNGGYLPYYPEAQLAAAHLQKLTGLHGGDEKGYWESLTSQKTIGQMMKVAGITKADIAGFANAKLGEAIAGAANATADATVSVGGDAASAISDSFGWMPDLWNAITTPALWMRLGYGLLGVVLVGGGLALAVRSSAMSSAVKTVKGIA